MVFKLVRTDTSEPCKIKLPVGTHIIGRGKLLVCEDKRVSRQHGELEVTEDSVSIKSLHSNPCFYIRRSTDNTQILKQECIINLSHGDKFGLLPCSYWYELIHCTSEVEDPASITENVTRSNNIENANYNAKTEEQVDNKSILDTQPNYDYNCQLNETVEKDLNISQPINERAAKDLNISQSSNEIIEKSQNESQPLNFSINESVADDAESPGSPSLIPADNPTSRKDSDDNQSVPSDQNAEARVKRSNSTTSDDSSPVDVKKVKTDPEDTKDVAPGPSNDQAGSSGDKKDNGVPPSPVKPVRERCIYGANCYRRNPQHKAEFSHPIDSDWGGGERGVCPYGGSCRRRDPRHWQQHTHPDGVDPPQPHPRPGVRKPKRRKSDTEEDLSDTKEDLSDTEDNQKALIVTGKRVRKTIKRPSYSGSESGNEDPYQTDESDEWRPGSNDLLSTQGYSQSTGE